MQNICLSEKNLYCVEDTFRIILSNINTRASHVLKTFFSQKVYKMSVKASDQWNLQSNHEELPMKFETFSQDRCRAHIRHVGARAEKARRIYVYAVHIERRREEKPLCISLNTCVCSGKDVGRYQRLPHWSKGRNTISYFVPARGPR